ncbi:MAG: toll/interleukin-1 receptor domain-containing protein [Gammaproteobacteria bacterium]|nr:toll/interleukin-1 receptor domain-containing protein [Gammaproteobacteria bacterium]
MKTNDFDVFLCHNSEDKPAVKQIGEELKKQGILPWLDEWELRPGLPWQPELEKQIKNIKAAAVFVGDSGMGPWQEQELNAFLREFVKRQCPVIPVLLPNAPKQPDLPVFLSGMTWVDFRAAASNPLQRLCWGITGKRGPGLL